MSKSIGYLGIDTSNYTTSVALCDASGKLIADERRVLEVKSGERGLRQSEALFQHTKNLPELMSRIDFSQTDIRGIGVSVSPRPQTNSYMPVFRAGYGTASALASVLNVPLLPFSHQEGHIRAAMAGCQCLPENLRFPILATHFSGGTSEIVVVDRKGNGFDCQIIGKTLDLNAGQLIDRVGVAMGLEFPAGKTLEALARPHQASSIRISSRVEGADFHFSGQENQAKALLAEGTPDGAVAFALLNSVAKTLECAIRFASQLTKIRTVLFSGGVMANGIIKNILLRRFKGSGMRLYFSEPKYATDNAVGISLLTRDALEEN